MVAVDLANLEDLLARANRVVPLVDVFNGDNDRLTIGLRHDVDDGGWGSCLAMARWEHERGYRSTFYFLHTAPYWPVLCSRVGSDILTEIIDMGHEVGLHNNALAEGRRQNRDPFEILIEAKAQLDDACRQETISTASHGDPDCYYGGFVNYQLFDESRSAHVATNFKTVEELGLETRPLADFGFVFQGDWLPRPHYLTDSGGDWTTYSTVPHLNQVLAEYPYPDDMLMILQHPDWWPLELYLAP